MPWYAWVLIALFVLNPIITIAKIGDRRKPYTSSDVIVSLIANGLIVWAVVALAT